MIKTATALTFGPGLTDKHQSIDLGRLREDRAAKARAVLRRHGIPAMLVSSEPNVRYLTGFSWGTFQPNLCYALFFAEHDPVLFAHAGSYQMPEIVPWIKNWRVARSTLSDIAGPRAVAEEYALFAQEIGAELKERGLTGEPLAVSDFDESARNALRESGLKIAEGWPLLLEASQCKTADEINCLKMAATFCSTGWQRFTEVCRPGMATSAIHRICFNAMSEAGGEPAGWMWSGPTTFERLITPVNRIIEYGDLVYYPLCGTSYLGYTACLYRTFKVGRKPTDKEKDWYKRVKDSLDAAIEATRIGKTTADAARAFPPASKWGYKDEAEVLSIEFGHGIGLASPWPLGVHYNYPNINRQWSLKHPQPFEKGMVIAYESCEGEHMVGGVRLENMVVVTETGPEIVDLYPRDEITVV
jgi:Xaa-Pro dipeptidase